MGRYVNMFSIALAPLTKALQFHSPRARSYRNVDWSIAVVPNVLALALRLHSLLAVTLFLRYTGGTNHRFDLFGQKPCEQEKKTRDGKQKSTGRTDEQAVPHVALPACNRA